MLNNNDITKFIVVFMCKSNKAKNSQGTPKIQEQL